MNRQELSSTNWHSLFLGLNTSEMSLVFTDVLLNICSRHISNKIITCNDKDAPWITPQVKSTIRRSSRVYRKWVQRGRVPGERDKVSEVQNSTNKLFNEANRTYYENLGNKLSDPDTGPNHFWTAFKRISNKKKQTNIPPIFENNCYVTNFQQKAQIFNDYFAEQCKINDNGSLLPEFISKTNASISQINITTNQIIYIIQIIQKHSAKKSRGCDDISVAMLQLCPTEVAVPLQLIFQKCVLTGAFFRFLEMRQHSPYS